MKDFKSGQPANQLGDLYSEIAQLEEPIEVSELRSRLILNGWTSVFSKNLKRAIEKLVVMGLVTYDKRSNTVFAVQYLPKDLKYVTMSNLRISPFTAGVIELTKDCKIKDYARNRSRYFKTMVLLHSRFLASIGVFGEEEDGEFYFITETPLFRGDYDSAPILPACRIYDDQWKVEPKKKVIRERAKSEKELDRYWAERSTKDIIELNRMMLHQIPCPLE